MERIDEFYVCATPERLWAAITDPDARGKFQFGDRMTSDRTVGSRFELTHEGVPGPLGIGENVEVDPPRRLMQTMVAHWDEGQRVPSGHGRASPDA